MPKIIFPKELASTIDYKLLVDIEASLQQATAKPTDQLGQFLAENKICSPTLFNQYLLEENIQELEKLNFLDIYLNTPNKPKTSQTPLHEAAREGRIKSAEFLLNENAELEAKDSEGWTPLHLAAADRQPEVAKLLLEKGADIEAKSKRQRTPLHNAALYTKNHETTTLDILLDYEANVHALDNNLCTPLHQVAQFSTKASVKKLLDKGAVVNAVDSSDRTPLHLAVLFTEAGEGAPELVECLLRHGAKSSRDKYGYTPLELAGHQNNEKINNETKEKFKALIEKYMDLNLDQENKAFDPNISHQPNRLKF